VAREVARELYEVAVECLESGRYTSAFVLAYVGLKVLKVVRGFEASWWAVLNGAELGEGEARKIVSELGKVLGGGEGVVVEVDLVGLLLGFAFLVVLGVVVARLGFLEIGFLRGMPLWIDAVLYPLLALLGVGLIVKRLS